MSEPVIELDPSGPLSGALGGTRVPLAGAPGSRPLYEALQIAHEEDS